MTALGGQVVVLAKAPVAGRVKTRLSPPFSPQEAASLADAALADTLLAVGTAGVRRRVLALDGTPGQWTGVGQFDVVAQRDGSLDQRIAHALDDAWAGAALPMLLVGMDTPQVTPSLLTAALRVLLRPGVDAVLGLAEDGGFWALGLREPRPDLVVGVRMSTERTGPALLARLHAAALRVSLLPVLRDVDNAADAAAVSGAAPYTYFAARWAALAAGHQSALAASHHPRADETAA